MTAQARITQAEFDKATRSAVGAVTKHGAGKARVIFRLAPREIEIIVSNEEAGHEGPNPWDDE